VLSDMASIRWVTLAVCVASACGRFSDRTSKEPDAKVLAASVRPAVVRVVAGEGLAPTSGSGFAVTADDGENVIVSAYHVVAQNPEVTLERIDGSPIAGTVIGSDPATDIAVIRPRQRFPAGPLFFGDDEALSPGEWVMAVGSPAGVVDAVSIGALSARGRVPVPTLAGHLFLQYLFFDAASGAGSSGGALLDARGAVVGVMTATLGGNPLGVALPAHWARRIVSALVHTGRYVHSHVGMRLADAPASGQPPGSVSVLSVTAGGPADQAHILAGDRLLSVDGRACTDAGELQSRAFMESPGTTWTAVVLRNGDRLTIRIVLEKLSDLEPVGQGAP
jgi:serine protease Do